MSAKQALLSCEEEEEFWNGGKVSGDEKLAQHEMSLGFSLGCGSLVKRVEG